MTEERARLMHLEAVSVLLPVRNGAGILGLAISDLIAGMQDRDELLIVDDGSQDTTPTLVAEWKQRDPRIRELTTSGIGLVEALNLGIRDATHDWIARADADDRYPTNRLSVQRTVLSPHVALVTGDYRLVPPEGEATHLPCALGHPFVTLSLINPQRIPHPGVMFRRDAVLEAGGYQAEDFPAEDLGLWMRMSEVGRFVGVPEVVVDWSLNAGSVSHSRQVEQRRRTAEMLAAFRPRWLSDVNETAIGEELARYACASHGSERALLLLRDLRSWQAKGMKIPGQAAVLRNLLGNPLSSFTAGLRLRREARNRDRWRKAHARLQLRSDTE